MVIFLQGTGAMCRLPMFLQWMAPYTFISRQQCTLDYLKGGGAAAEDLKSGEAHWEELLVGI